MCQHSISTDDGFGAPVEDLSMEGGIAGRGLRVPMSMSEPVESEEEIAYWHALGLPTPLEMWGPRHGEVETLFTVGINAAEGQGDPVLSPTQPYYPVQSVIQVPCSEPQANVLVDSPFAFRGEVRCLHGINIQRPWARMILSGVKTIEARRYRLCKYIDEDLWVIETPGTKRRSATFQSKIIGVVRFGSDFRYQDLSQWRSDESQHCIERCSRFDWKGPELDSAMYGWRVVSASLLAEPQSLLAVKGVIGCEAGSRHVVTQDHGSLLKRQWKRFARGGVRRRRTL